MIEKKYLFSPGPVMTSPRIKASLTHPDICHRRPMFEQILARVRQNLLKLFSASEDYTAVVVSGSGTAANETALSSIIRQSEEVLLIKNGEFGERLADILSCYQYSLHVLDYAWGELPRVDDVTVVLQEHPQIQWVCMVFHETGTAMINPVREIGEVVHQFNKYLYVDCVSAFGGEDVDVLRDHIDICSSVPNKAVSGLPGVSFVVARRSSIPPAAEIPARNVYLNLQKHISVADKTSQTPNTPSVNMIVALDEALQELIEEGLSARIQRYQACASVIRQGVRKLNLKILLPDEISSNTVTSVFLPKELSLAHFIDRLDEKGYVVYPGKRHLFEQNMFQIANMGQIHVEDCRMFLKVLEETLNEMGWVSSLN
ncbi:MAG: alanine--glyoxylate aminotransferase family protein [Anaerolineales bacterium]